MAITGDLQNIGFIGLGVMGMPMATHLVSAGYCLSVYDVDPHRVQQLFAIAATEGAATKVSVAANPAEVANSSDVVFTMLPDGEAVQQVSLGEDGLIEGLRAGSLLVDTSSSQPWLTQQTAEQLAANDVAMIDAPVSGAQWGAEAATLVFMLGGEPADVARVRPLLQCMGESVFHLGAVGCGHAMKCLNNLITALTFTATAEGLVIGKRYGLDPAVMVDVLDASTGGSWISENHIRQRILSRTFDDPFKLELMLKDVDMANRLAEQTGASVPLSTLGQELYGKANRAAGPGVSVSELVRWVETLSKTEITAGACRAGADKTV